MHKLRIWWVYSNNHSTVHSFDKGGRVTSIHGIIFLYCPITHWGRVTHICVGNLAIIGSDNGLSPGRCQSTIWTNAGILLIGPLGTNISEIRIGIRTFWVKKIHLKMSSAKWRLFCLGHNVLMNLTRAYFAASFSYLNKFQYLYAPHTLSFTCNWGRMTNTLKLAFLWSMAEYEFPPQISPKC